MNLEKAQKHLTKLHKRGFHGYPLIAIQYVGKSAQLATKVTVSFTEDESSQTFDESFTTQNDIRHDEVIQTTLIKIINRAQAKSVTIHPAVLIEK